MNNINVGSLGSLFLILIIIGYFVFKYIKKEKNKDNNAELKKFFESIRITTENAMLKYLETVDITNITNITDMQKEILKDLYDTVWDICIDELSKMTDESTAKFIKSLLTRSNVERFIQEVYENSIPVQTKVTVKYNNSVLAAARK